MEELVREGPLFDSFSESCDSKEGSLRGGNAHKAAHSVFGPFLQACLEEAAAGAAGSPGRGAEEDHEAAAVEQADATAAAEAARDEQQAVSSTGLARDRSGTLPSLSSLPRTGSMDGAMPTSSYGFSTQGSLGSTLLPCLQRAEGSASAPIHEQDPETLPLHWRQAVDDDDVPRSALFDHPCPVGALPSPRWGHAHAAVGDRFFIFGGDGPGMHAQRNAYSFDPGALSFLQEVQNAWRAVPVPAAGHEDALPAMSGHAACPVRNRIFIFGGRSGRKYLRRTYVFDTELATWKCPRKAPGTPPGLAGHSLTAVGQHGIYLFGGAGAKQPSGDVFRCDPDTLDWTPVDTKGERPSGRQRHSAVWDFSDSLIVFGGLSDSALFADVHVLSLSTGYWSRPACAGHAPTQRSGHSAIMVAANLMLVFGGCNAQGKYYSDLHLLNTSTFRWHRLAGVSAAPSPRYGHACCALAGKALVHGGSSGMHAFSSVFTVSISFGHDFNRAAMSLAAQLRNSRGSSSASAGSHASAGSQEEAADTEAMRVKLAALLQRRSANDMQAFAARRADISEGLLQKERARSANLQAQVQELRLLLEEQQNAKEAAREELRQERLSSKRTAERAHTNHMRHMQAHAAELSQLQAQNAELAGHRSELEARERSLQEQCATLRGEAKALHGDNAALEQRLQTAAAQLAQQVQERELAMTRLAAAQEQAQVLQQRNEALAAGLAQKEAALQAAARRLQQERGAPLSEAGQQQLACLRGDAAALAKCSLAQLYSLEGVLSGAWRGLREAITAKGAQELRERESALAARERAAEEMTTCSLCMDGPKAVAFNCGHQTCARCSGEHAACPFCRQPISSRITLFQT